MWIDLKRSDSMFADTSPFQLRNEATISATPGQVFDAITQSMEEWFADIRGIEWTSSAPHGAGSTRIVRLKALSVKERFVNWVPGKRITYAMDSISIPLVKQLMGDVHLTPDGAGTRVEWVLHYQPSLLMRAVHPLARALFSKMFRDSLRNLEQWIQRARQ